MPLEQAEQHLLQEEKDQEEEHLSIAQLRANRRRSEPSESVLPIVVVDAKEKVVEVPTSN